MSLFTSRMSKWAGALALGGAAMVATLPAQAQVSWSVGVHAPGISVGVANPVPVYYPPAPVYHAPPPVYYRPAPVYYGPPPAYYRPAPVYYGPGHRHYAPPRHARPHHGHGHRR